MSVTIYGIIVEYEKKILARGTPDEEILFMCKIEMPEEAGGMQRGPYTFLCPPHIQIHPYIGMGVEAIANNGTGVCYPVNRNFKSTANTLSDGDVQIGCIDDDVTIKFTRNTITVGINTVKNVIINAETVTVNSKNINLNAEEITSTANITTTGNITGATVTGNTDVIGGSISLKNHKHNVVAVGSPTSPPNA